MKLKYALVLLCFLSGPAWAQVYHVAIDVIEDDKVIASPELVVNEGKKASVAISNVFELVMTVREQTNLFAVSTRLTSGDDVIYPSLLMKPNEPASVMIGATGLRLTIKTENSR